MSQRLEQKTRRLIAARAIRSVAQGALVVDFVFYLRALSSPASAIGVLVAARMAFSVTLTFVFRRLTFAGPA